MKNTITLFDVPMHPLTMEETVNEISRRLDDGEFVQHVVVNVAKVVKMQTDPVLRESVISCDIINIDGAGVVIGGRFLGLDIPERVAGVDLFLQLLGMASNKKLPVYLLGAKQEIIEKTVSVLTEKFPELHIAGYHHGYFWDDEESVVSEIKNSGAKLLFVAITSPMKENFINRWKEVLGVNFVMGVGGTFDVIAGKVKRAPVWMQNAGLEWFYRVIQEPRRMWKRYLVTNSNFAWMLLKAKMKQLISS